MVGEHALPNFVGDPGVGELLILGFCALRCLGGVGEEALSEGGFSEEGLLDDLSVLLLDTFPDLAT